VYISNIKGAKMIELNVFTPGKGHGEFKFDDVEPSQRADLAKTVTELIRAGHSVIVEFPDGACHRVIGYDESANEWLMIGAREVRIAKRNSKKSKKNDDENIAKKVANAFMRLLAKDTKATAVSASSGG
jgi:phenylpyruvate tautomerase PptA (4-oxalocrotonate tautomerase family)